MTPNRWQRRAISESSSRERTRPEGLPGVFSRRSRVLLVTAFASQAALAVNGVRLVQELQAAVVKTAAEPAAA